MAARIKYKGHLSPWSETNTNICHLPDPPCFSFVTTFNPFIFIGGLSSPCSVQTSLTQNCLKLNISGFPYNCLPVSCGDIVFKKSRSTVVLLEIRPESAFTALGPSYQVLSDLRVYSQSFCFPRKHKRNTCFSEHLVFSPEKLGFLCSHQGYSQRFGRKPSLSSSRIF